MSAYYGERLIVSARPLCRAAVASCCKGQLESTVAAIRRHRFMVPDDLVVGKCTPEPPWTWGAGCPLPGWI